MPSWAKVGREKEDKDKNKDKDKDKGKHHIMAETLTLDQLSIGTIRISPDSPNATLLVVYTVSDSAGSVSKTKTIRASGSDFTAQQQTALNNIVSNITTKVKALEGIA